MSAALTLEFSGPAVGCSFPGCILDSFHDGDHAFPPPKPALGGPRYFTCSECGGQFVVYGERIPGERNVCDSQACLVAMSRRGVAPIPCPCPCAQRSYPHDLRVHKQLRSESYDPKLKYRWPWSLALSPRLEFSAERKEVA
jgi:hypothetical protein